MSKLASWSLKKRLLWASIVVVLILVGALTAVWVTQRSDSHSDCSAVEQLGRQWIAMSQAVTALENGSGERQDIFAIADKESAMSDTIRAAAGSVSDPALKDQLGKWAQGTSLLAKNQRDAANSPPQSNPSSEDADYYHAAVMTREATQALLQSCPNMPRLPPAS